jgi:hypothetical protein
LATGTGLAHHGRYRQFWRVHVARQHAGDDQARRHAAERIVRSALACALRVGAGGLAHDVLDGDADEDADRAADVDQRGAPATDIEVARHHRATERAETDARQHDARTDGRRALGAEAADEQACRHAAPQRARVDHGGIAGTDS